MRDTLFRQPQAATPAASPAASSVIKRLSPGAPGTRRLQQRYGEELVCVRYRETSDGSARFTTVEIVVDRRPVAKRAADPAEHLVRIAFGEGELREKAKAAGGRWDPKLKLWRLPGPAIRALRLKDRIVKPG